MSSSSKKKCLSLSQNCSSKSSGERVCFFFDFFLSFLFFYNLVHVQYQTPKKILKGRKRRRRRKEKELLRDGITTDGMAILLQYVRTSFFLPTFKRSKTLRGGAEKNDAVLRAQTHRIPLFVVVVVVVVVFFRGSTARQKAVSSHFPSTQCHSSRDRASPQGFPVRNEKK